MFIVDRCLTTCAHGLTTVRRVFVVQRASWSQHEAGILHEGGGGVGHTHPTRIVIDVIGR